MTAQPHPDRVRLLPWFAWPPLLIDALLAGLLALAAVLRIALTAEANAWPDLVFLVLAVVVIFGRRRFPEAAVIGGTLLSVVDVAANDQASVLMPATLIALYHYGTVRPWRPAVVAGAGTVVVFAGVVVTLLEQGRIEGGALASVAWPAFAVSAGLAVQAGRASLAGAQERARRAEATRELEARRRVSEERLRIARDVHDLVAHHLAVVNVQAGVASHVLRTDPDAAETALDTIRTSASTGVGELGQLLSVLRDPAEAGGPTDPTPDLAAIDDLIASFGASGLRVAHTTSGSPRPVGSAAQVAAYRVIQEALTNAHKHGDGEASVMQRFGDDGLELVVENRHGAGAAADGTALPSGFGLVGMRERVEATGGTLTIDDDGANFRVRAVLPIGEGP
ncbi:MAG: histidine kinase [Actinomycetota bacterium]